MSPQVFSFSGNGTPMDRELIEKLVLFYFVNQTLAIVILLEIIFYGKPYLTLFGVIFAGTLYLNFKYFGRPKQRKK